jgi:hypothetical protein
MILILIHILIKKLEFLEILLKLNNQKEKFKAKMLNILKN